jgi:3-hydroxyisobutyrate dehydrogenase
MKVAFIGMGTMGAPMAMNLLKAGHEVTVHNRTREREESVAKAGARRAESPREAAQGAQIIVTCVSDTPDVENIILGDNGVIHGAPQGSIVVDMSTISPTVSGGSEGAQKGTLSIMIGGDEQDLTTAKPVLQAMGETITHIGPVGAGQMTKAINQIVAAGTYWAVAEGIALGLKAGLDMEKIVQAVGGGAASSWPLVNRSSNMINNSYPLGFKVQLHRKDLTIALEVARELGVTLPVSAYVEQVETGLIACGYGDEDISAIARSIREASGIE